MVTPVKDAAAMIAGMDPVRGTDTYIFCTTQNADFAASLSDHAFARIAEAEGITLILSRENAAQAGFDISLPMARITLRVHSALDGVGLTAAVATALAEHGIPCNMVAGYHHDHAFVPVDQADTALTILRDIAAQATLAEKKNR